MLWLIKQVFIALLIFSGYSATKCLSLNNEQCIARLILIDLNPHELNDCPLIVNLDKCNRIFNAVDDISTKLCVPSETKHVNVKDLI